jgi:hypothetical protein
LIDYHENATHSWNVYSLIYQRAEKYRDMGKKKRGGENESTCFTPSMLTPKLILYIAYSSPMANSNA